MNTIIIIVTRYISKFLLQLRMTMKTNTYDLVLKPEQYWILWRTSFLCLITCFYAIYKGFTDLAILPAAIFLTSINYWRHPDYSWRRYLDITVVFSSIFYLTYWATKHAVTTRYYYYACLFIGLCFFMTGIFYKKTNDLWWSTYSHALFHVFGNLSGMILFSGFVTTTPI
jgi:hypothetical protein